MKLLSARSAVFGFMLACGMLRVSAQSTDQSFPSPVTTNEISGTIKVRDIGDSRVTSYFYTFDGGQGDIFINAVTRNFSGDIDIFAADDMRPLTKMVIYADSGSQETGWLIYLRKGERLILRVEGRSPNDDPASFRIKFGGSFIALAPEKAVAEPTVAATAPIESGVRVNSVGTIIQVIPKAVPVKTPKPVTKAPETTARTENVAKNEPKKKAEPPPKKEATAVVKKETAKVVVEPPKKPPTRPPVKTQPPAKSKTTAAKPPKPVEKPPEKPAESASNPLASIWLVIELKDGYTIRRPMSEVTKFNIENGTLVVTAKNGKIVRYRILEVAKITIE